MASTRDHGVRIAIDVRDEAEGFVKYHTMLTPGSEEALSQTVWEIQGVGRWKTI